MDYFRKKIKKQVGGGLRTYFSENLPGFFGCFYFTPGNSRQNKASPQETPQIRLHPLKILSLKPRHPWKFHIIFS